MNVTKLFCVYIFIQSVAKYIILYKKCYKIIYFYTDCNKLYNVALGGICLFYFRRIWTAIYLAVGFLYLSCRYVIVKFFDYIGNFWIAYNYFSSDAPFKSFISKVNSFSTGCLYSMGFLFIILVVWLIVDIFSGQFKLDLKSAQITRLLRRQVSSESLQVVASEERSANRWIRKGRIVKRDGKLMFVIPCFGSSAVAAIIQKRCEEYLPKWLDNNFSRIKWTPLDTKTSGLGTWFLVREK